MANRDAGNGGNGPPAPEGGSGGKHVSPISIALTFLATLGLVVAIAFLFPGLNSLKIKFFSAAVEIDNQEDAFTLLDRMYGEEGSRRYLDAWLDEQGYVALEPPRTDAVTSEERKKAARLQAAKFSNLVPDENLHDVTDPRQRAALLEEFEAKTSDETLAGQLRRLASEKDPPFNNIGFAATASTPDYGGHRPDDDDVIYVNANTDLARFLLDGTPVALANPNSVAAETIQARVKLTNIRLGTKMHLNRRQWCRLSLQSFADPDTGVADVIIVPLSSEVTNLAEGNSTPSGEGADFLSADYEQPCNQLSR